MTIILNHTIVPGDAVPPFFVASIEFHKAT